MKLIPFAVSLSASFSLLTTGCQTNMPEVHRDRAPEGRQVVTGIGGVFFKCADPQQTTQWYETHLGIRTRHFEGEGKAKTFEWRDEDDPSKRAHTVWSTFNADTDYFDPGHSEFMVNYRVDDLDAMLAQLQQDGIETVRGPMEWFNGRFAWILDPDGRTVELWEPGPGY